MTVHLGGKPVSDADLLDVVGPGLAPTADAPPIAALDWNAFAFRLGARLLDLYARQSSAQQHVIDICSTAVAIVGSVRELLAKPDRVEAMLAQTEATLRPMTMFSKSPAAELQLRIFRWGVRRIHRDRRLHDALADLARDAAEAHAELAARAGLDPGVARAAELAAQRADAATILAGQASSLVG
jgi:hypothetical protein